ncbi:3'-5' exonuclease family protein [Kingella negevensis]|uniref:3'-5' exonuclease family protein n=1 Tax=Kingella negevensis TaxID=1522312 RepID=UPI002550F1F6|nr:3'-5' exonuclease family protein [Kingella negevensis]MDK4679913.1 exonuclease domain-containing protein [Kingella negevensis]MDK4682368.1 exonuclease domain-containing protein [Kingella negevensis]MDK4690565.1 exonuclease domain-containing protein [Kingella negevensis]MDK4692087.1 exonuclease domain-containing protein [Kingella negevensis]MDK4698392.1 exonuclease domain-containing protein [Kingella negevensis]
MLSSFNELAAHFAHYPTPVVIIDLETTGGNLTTDRITEIAFLHFWQGKITPVQQLINPTTPISSFVQDLTGISNEMVATAPQFTDFAPNILPLLRGSLLIAHNSKFDYTILRHEFQRMGVPFATPALCSVQLSRKLYPEFYKHNLDTIIERHNIAVEDRHRAMSDVLALAEFLQLSVKERGESAWFQAAKQLFNPPMLPENVNPSIFQAAFELSDNFGVSIWYDAAGQTFALHEHEHAFREVAVLLRQSTYARAAKLVFVPTLGALHNVQTRAEIMAEHGLLPTDEIVRHSILVQQDIVSGCLKTRIRPLREGFYDEPPRGLFLNTKAAKRALSTWAKEQDLCPNMLGILPNELPKGTPCPVSVVGKCSAACEAQDVAAHNMAVQAALVYLPVCDWGKSKRVCVTEVDKLSGRAVVIVCDSGAILLSDGRWFVSADALAVMKQKFKTAKHEIKTA